MAYEIPGFTYTLTAGADLSGSQYRLVKLNASGQAVPITAVTDIPCGALQNKPASGQAATIMAFGVTKLQGAADLSCGNQIGPSANGQAAAYVAGTDSTRYIVGQVLEDNTTAGGLITALINCAAPHRGA